MHRPSRTTDAGHDYAIVGEGTAMGVCTSGVHGHQVPLVSVVGCTVTARQPTIGITNNHSIHAGSACASKCKSSVSRWVAQRTKAGSAK